ncbi:MAG: FAD-dependent oxidoreductase [Phycisphaerae bacterium]
MNAEVVVVGAGVIGLAVAWELGSRGMKVLVLDRGRVGEGASSCSLGALMPHAPTTIGPLQQLQWASLGMYPAWIAKLEAATGQSCSYRRAGRVEVLTSSQARSKAQKQVAAQAAWQQHGLTGVLSLHAQVIQEVRDLVESPWGYLCCTATAQVAVRPLLTALVHGIRQQGGDVIENCAVRMLQATPNTCIIGHDHGTLSARWVALTCGAWSSQLPCQGLTVPAIVPVKGQAIHLAREGSEAQGTMPMIKSDKCYLLDHAGNDWLVGSTTEPDAGFDASIPLPTAELLRGGAGALRHVMMGRRITNHWAGFRPRSADRQPVIGWLSSTVLIASGHYKIGVGMAPATAIVIADLMEGREAGWPIAAFDPLRPSLYGRRDEEK